MDQSIAPERSGCKKATGENPPRLQRLKSRPPAQLLTCLHGYHTVDPSTPRAEELEAALLKITEAKPQAAVA